ncbi:MAG: UDP-N-acetylglucosamine 2-epimerase (non-hydrolyzing) [Methanomicrobiales archaeon]|nr:UDP-N-acetylglucosamine 2-epimerase (non-hydrolyzing) [Methanomicrobiales archaeon]
MKIVSIVGARPQFIKCAPLSQELRKRHEEILVHTGQHYDPEMSGLFFEELRIPHPAYNLGVGSGTHGWQTGEMLKRVEGVLLQEEPEMVIVYGDTNSTLAGALAAAKLHVPIAHVEAGLRSFDRRMPEEINRVLTDHLSALLLCPTETALLNLKREGITEGVHLSGDVMVDALLQHHRHALEQARILERLGLHEREYLVLTLHRPSNTDSRDRLLGILRAIGDAKRKVVFPVHPRTAVRMKEYGPSEKLRGEIITTAPLGYLEMLRLLSGAEKCLTDSGGVQKEAYILGIPCITLRDSTEWVETLADGWNVLAGTDRARILEAIAAPPPAGERRPLFGGEGAARRMAEAIDRFLSSRA